MVGQSRGAGQHLGTRGPKAQWPGSTRRPWHITWLCGSSGASLRLGLSLQSGAQVQPSRSPLGLPQAAAGRSPVACGPAPALGEQRHPQHLHPPGSVGGSHRPGPLRGRTHEQGLAGAEG